MKVHQFSATIEYWYDPRTRCWWTREVDRKGYQIGAAEHAYMKEDILDAAAHLNGRTPS